MMKSKHKKDWLSTFGLPGTGIETRTFKTVAEATREIKRAHKKGFPVIPAGHGTNCAFLEASIPAIFLKSSNASITSKSKGKFAMVTIGAAKTWDDFVGYTVEHGWAGIECLSGIPGTAGAAPVQNIGAYGASLSDVFESVQCVNLKSGKALKLSRAACHFGYRTSIFNTSRRGEFLVTSLTVKLLIDGMPDISRHGELKKMLPANPTLLQVRSAVLAIRKRKLPDYQKFPNCGSFFKNPIVDKKFGNMVLKKYSSAPHWMESDGTMKFSAAWLIEQSGARNKRWGKIAISPQHALVLINRGEKNHERLREAINAIAIAVEKKFGIMLDPEPNLLNARYAKEFARAQF